jgi:protein-tyrosine phosphatase
MKDLHSHLLFGIDDGSKTKEESIELLKEASESGITDIVLTPHYIKDSKYNANNEKKNKLLKELKDELESNNIRVNLYLGNEVFIDEGIPELLNKEISSINNTKYILVELPLHYPCVRLDSFLYEIIKNGMIPIIAHPERYTTYYKNFEFFEDLIAKGCILQGNIGSLYKKYGKRSKNMLKYLLKRDMIHVLGCDAHHRGDFVYAKNVEKCLFKILKDKNKVNDLLENNFNKILNNQDI